MVFFLSCVARILATARRVFGVGLDVLSMIMMIEACHASAPVASSSCETRRVFEIFTYGVKLERKNTREERYPHHHLSSPRRTTTTTQRRRIIKSYLMMVSADAHSPVLGVSFATDNDDDFDETVVCFSPSLLFFSRGEEKDTTTVPGCVVVVVVVVARVGIPIPSMSVRHAACSLRPWYDEKTGGERRGVCVRACVRLRGYFKCGGRFLSKKITFRIFQRQKSHAIFSKRQRARRRFRRRSARVRFSRVVFDAASFGLPRVLDDIPRANAMPRRSIGRYFESSSEIPMVDTSARDQR